MHRPRILVAIGILCSAAAAQAADGLQWERYTIEVAAQPGQKVVHVEFPFRNAGDRVVTIVSVETSCRCTSADTSKKSYSPGEKDAVSVDLAIGAQSGLVEKSVTVTTDGPELKPFLLSLKVRVPGPP
ncbi:MAG TPA: DUF1573 domain-containing protein [Opitutaceae bacterium]